MSEYTEEEGEQSTTKTIPPVGPVNEFQKKQIAYVEALQLKIDANGYEPMDMKVECKTENIVMEHASTVEEITEFITQHGGHYTWTTNNHFATAPSTRSTPKNKKRR